MTTPTVARSPAGPAMTDRSGRGVDTARQVARIISMERRTIDDLLADARRGLDRVEAETLASEQVSGALVVDIRPFEQRRRDGDLPGAVVIDRNVLEWRLDPSSPHRVDDVLDYDCRIIVVCNEGYSSSLAASTLRRLGLRRATDLVGGYQAWRAAMSSPRRLQSTR